MRIHDERISRSPPDYFQIKQFLKNYTMNFLLRSVIFFRDVPQSHNTLVRKSFREVNILLKFSVRKGQTENNVAVPFSMYLASLYQGQQQVKTREITRALLNMVVKTRKISLVNHRPKKPHKAPIFIVYLTTFLLNHLPTRTSSSLLAIECLLLNNAVVGQSLLQYSQASQNATPSFSLETDS